MIIILFLLRDLKKTRKIIPIYFLQRLLIILIFITRGQHNYKCQSL